MIAIAALLAVFALLPVGESWAFAVDSSAELCHHAVRASDIRGALDYLPPPCMAAAVRPAQETSSHLLRNPGLTDYDKHHRLKAAGMVNMFPHTAHVESMALFER